MPSKRLWCKWACPFVPQGLSFAPRFYRGAKLWTQLRASKAVFSSIRQIDEKTGLNATSLPSLSYLIPSSVLKEYLAPHPQDVSWINRISDLVPCNKMDKTSKRTA